MELKIGFIGCGGIAGVHASRLSKMEGVKLVAFCDIAKEKALAFSSKFGGAAYQDFHEMIKSESLDVVYVCLPPFAHSDEVQASAERGINVFIEKPIALSMRLADDMVRAVRRSGVRSQVGYLLRFGAGVERAKALIDSGEAGDVSVVQGRYFCNFIGGPWWRDKAKSGGQLVEQSTHLYDAVRYLCGDVERVYAEMARRYWVDVPDMTSEDASSTVMRFKTGALGSITATTGAYAGDRWVTSWTVAARNFTFEFENANSLVIYSTSKPQTTETVSDPERDMFVLESMDLFDSIKSGRETRTPIEEGMKTLELTLAAAKSAEKRQVVELPLPR
ncbi:MAG: Gfo/Idh/MocA family oxidoreductase [Candidatus Brockarchaeota archaeon]|nr:Gfo/Idh/MocA family oxidoreductase [Candidatus Brockarchaeota archaeon]